MSLLNGTLKYTRFRVVDPGEAFATVDIDALETAIAARRFVPLSPASETLESAGWVPLESPFDDTAAIASPLFLFEGNKIVLSYREDKITIPKPLLKRKVQARIAQIIADEGKNPDDISKAFVKAVEQSIVRELREKIPAKSKIIEVVLEPTSGRIFGKGTVVDERIASLIERTFQIRIELAIPAADAFAMATAPETEILSRLPPAYLFADTVTRVDYDDAGDDE